LIESCSDIESPVLAPRVNKFANGVTEQSWRPFLTPSETCLMVRSYVCPDSGELDVAERGAQDFEGQRLAELISNIMLGIFTVRHRTVTGPDIDIY
jgi:hypothetical protein